MPTPNPTTRREYKGAAAGTTLQNSMTSSDTTFVLVSANNWPTGGVGKFVVTVNRGLADEEKILCDTQSSRNVSCLLANRGFDGTTAQSHAAGATVECTISAFDADEWNQHTNATTGVHGVAGAVVGTTDVQNVSNKTFDAASSLGGVTGTQLAADRTALATYTPVLTNIALGNGSIAGYFKQVGKNTYFAVRLVLGSTTVISTHPALGLPAATPAREFAFSGVAYDNSADTLYAIGGLVNGNNTNITLAAATGNVSSTNPFTFATGDVVTLSGWYEAA